MAYKEALISLQQRERERESEKHLRPNSLLQGSQKLIRKEAQAGKTRKPMQRRKIYEDTKKNLAPCTPLNPCCLKRVSTPVC